MESWNGGNSMVDLEKAVPGNVSLESMLGIDPTLPDLGNLPRGWRAYRDGPGEPWQRTKAT